MREGNFSEVILRKLSYAKGEPPNELESVPVIFGELATELLSSFVHFFSLGCRKLFPVGQWENSAHSMPGPACWALGSSTNSPPRTVQARGLVMS